MTAVRRIRAPRNALQNAPRSQESVELPEDAMAYLFGPLAVAIHKEAHDAVAAATATMKAVEGDPSAQA